MRRRPPTDGRRLAALLGVSLLAGGLGGCAGAASNEPAAASLPGDLAAADGPRIVDFSALTRWEAPYPGARYTEDFAVARGGVPDDVALYHGARVRIFGYAEPLPAEAGVTTRLFLLDHPVGCCPTGPPRLHQMIDVRLVPGDSEVAPNAPILVTGTLEVGPWPDEHGYVESYFRLQDARWAVAAPRPLVHRN